MSADIKFGDRVRVTYEGTWEGDPTNTSQIKKVTGVDVGMGTRTAFSVEKIEPPVEVFKPGDRLRRIGGGYEVTLGNEGYLLHSSHGQVGVAYHKYQSTAPEYFDSCGFIKLDVVEKPF